jgi:hypothetical protein
MWRAYIWESNISTVNRFRGWNVFLSLREKGCFNPVDSKDFITKWFIWIRIETGEARNVRAKDSRWKKLL